VPLSTLVDSVVKVSPLAVNHQGQFPSVTISLQPAAGHRDRPGSSSDPEDRERAAQAVVASATSDAGWVV
jgi:multidrug efflux pump subunit AcrB